jgi:hypothetical protein
MKFLKGLALFLLSSLLFLSLTVFGFAYMLNNTLLNPDFVTTQLNRLNISALVEEILSQQPEDVTSEALVKTITELEPAMKEQLGAATDSIYDYLLGKSQNLDLALTLRNTILDTDFVVSIMDTLDMSSLIRESLKEQLSGEIPEEMIGYLDKPLDDTLDELEPWIKDQIGAAADPMLDYLFGQSQGFSVEISLEPVKESLRDNLRQAFLQSPPPELAIIPPAMLEEYFDQFYQEFAGQFPATLVINETLLGTEMPAQIAQILADAEAMLEEGRQYVSYFQLGYNVLIGFMLLLVLGIILLNRQVKGSTRELGTIFLTYGAFEYAGILVAKYFVGGELARLPVPPQLQAWLPGLVSDLLAPLEMFSLGLLIGGVVLLIVSFVYPRIRPSQPSTETVPS